MQRCSERCRYDGAACIFPSGKVVDTIRSHAERSEMKKFLFVLVLVGLGAFVAYKVREAA